MKIQFLGFILLVAGCTSKQSEAGRVVSSEEFLTEIIEIMESNSINRYDIDWDKFREQVFTVADSSVSDSSEFYGYERSTLLAIRKALELLKDGHSMYRTSYGTLIRVSTRSCSAPYPDVPAIPDNIGYIKVGSLSGFGNDADGYTASIRNKIKEQDREDLIGWIVDLRDNSGGNMWPMIAAIGTLLGEGDLGYFISPDGNEVKWEYKENSSVLNGLIQHSLNNSDYQLYNKKPPIAVLINNRVSSSGEAVAIAFKKRPNTRFFGTPTCGLSTANYGTPLHNGGMLLLTVSTMADREKELYGDSILPDIQIDEPTEVVNQAIEWLSSM